MSKVSLIKTSFNGGELSPRLDGRVDIDKYSNGCSVLENFIPLVQGGIMKRPGTQFISSTKGDQKVWLAKFEFTYQQSFILEFGHMYIRFYFNHGQIVSGSTPYEIATPYTTSHLTTAEGTFALSMAQTGDVIYIASRNHPPAKLSRLSNTNWTYSVVNFKEGPFEDNNTNKLLKVIVTGLQLFIGGPFVEYPVTLDSTGALFNSSMVGTLFQIEVTDDKTKPWYSQISPTTTAVTNLNDLCRNDGKYYGCNVSQGAKKTWYVAPTHTDGGRFDGDEISWWYLSDEIGVVRIDSVHSATNATGTVLKQVAYTAVPAETWAWSKAAWRSDIGYPDQVTFFRERLVFARDQKVWFSTSGDYENFAAKEFGEVLTDSAISIDITSEDSSPIKYLVSTPQGLICGTNSDQVLVAAASIAEPFGPTNIIVSPGSGIGGRQISPAKVDQSVLVIQRSGKKLFNTQYDANSNFFISLDQTVISDHILSPGIVDIAWQRDPWTVLWMVRADGQLIGFTFNQQQQVQGFHRHITTDGAVEAIQVIPSPDGSKDDLWMVVRRSGLGIGTGRYVELLKTDYQIGDNQANCWYSDSALQYNGAATTTISGLNHLIGKSVQILANGASHPNVTVSASGSISLNYPVTSAIVGLPYTALVQTMNLEGGANNGTSQGKVKRIDRIIIRLLDSMGNIQCAPSTSGNQLGKFDIVTFHNTNDRLDLPPPIFTGDVIVNLSSEYNRVGRICIKQSEGFPLTILAIMPDVNTYER